MITLTVCNHKGGTGKTTTAIHVAAALGLSGLRVLVVDLDPQAFLTRMLGVAEPAPDASVLALFDPNTNLGEVRMQEMKSFDLLPASSRLTNVMRKLNKPTDVFWTKETLEQGAPYDVVLFDTAAAVTVFSLNALVASRNVLIPVMPEYQPVLGAEQTYQTVQLVRGRLNPHLESPVFLFTQVDARKRTHYLYRRYLRKHYGDRVMSTQIRTSAALSVSYSDGTTTFDHDPHSRGARDYANATDELLGIIAPGGGLSTPGRIVAPDAPTEEAPLEDGAPVEAGSPAAEAHPPPDEAAALETTTPTPAIPETAAEAPPEAPPEPGREREVPTAAGAARPPEAARVEP